MRMPSFLFASALVASLVACSTTPASRIESQQGVFDTYPAAVQQKIREGQVGVGFTTEQVRLALGEPSRTFVQETAAGQSEVWAYSDSKPAFSFGVGGFSGGSSGLGGGVGVGTGGNRYDDDKVRVTFVGGLVTAVEQVATK